MNEWDFGKWVYEKYQSLRLIHGLTEQDKIPSWEELTPEQRAVFAGLGTVITSELSKPKKQRESE